MLIEKILEKLKNSSEMQELLWENIFYNSPINKPKNCYLIIKQISKTKKWEFVFKSRISFIIIWWDAKQKQQISKQLYIIFNGFNSGKYNYKSKFHNEWNLEDWNIKYLDFMFFEFIDKSFKEKVNFN